MSRDVADKYYTEIGKRGFDAFIDTADKGVIGDNPLVIISPTKSVSVKNSVPLTESDIQLASKKYKEEKKKAKVEAKRTT